LTIYLGELWSGGQEVGPGFRKETALAIACAGMAVTNPQKILDKGRNILLVLPSVSVYVIDNSINGRPRDLSRRLGLRFDCTIYGSRLNCTF
jgi:hypothetical protein